MSALIIFLEKPDTPQDKTASTQQAAEADEHPDREQWLEELRKVTTDFPGEKFLFYPDYPNWNDAWDISIYRKRIQQGDTHHERMAAAFALAFEEGHDRAVMITSDCPELTSGMVLEAMDALNVNDLVIGPAKGGSFYLLGMKILHPDFSASMPLHLDTVQPRTSIVLPGSGLSCYVLPVVRNAAGVGSSGSQIG